MRIVGILLIGLAVFAQIPLYVAYLGPHDSIALFSQFIGSTALILMATSQLLATRMPGFETIFGPLDQMYRLHKWLGILAMAAMGLHDVVDAEMDTVRGGGLEDIAEEFGEIGLYGILLLAFASLLTAIPYPLWRLSHKFIGAFFAMSFFHYFFIAKPSANTTTLGLYITIFCAAGLLAYLHLLILRPLLNKGHRYTVTSVKRNNDILDIHLKPTGRGISHKAGQFAFLSFDKSGLEEIHPYTISTARQSDRSLRFSVKALGSYTSRLANILSEGDTARITGAHGHFNMPSDARPQIWIAAGVGITPFLAWASGLSEAPKAKVTLYYCVRDAKKAAFVDELQAIADRFETVTLRMVESKNGKRISARDIADELGSDIKKARFAFCGPVSMRIALVQGLTERGAARSRIQYEAFEMRSGIGFDKFLVGVVKVILFLVGRVAAAKKLKV